MEYAKEIIALLGSIIITLVGGGGLLYYNVNKRLKHIQIDREASTEWKKLYDEQVEENKVITGRCNELYLHRRQQSDEINQKNIELAKKEVELVHKDVIIARKDAEIADKNAELAKKDVEIVRLTYDKCIINGCDKRKPKRNEAKKIT